VVFPPLKCLLFLPRELYPNSSRPLPPITVDLHRFGALVAHTTGITDELRRQLSEIEKQLADEQKRRHESEWKMVQLESQNKQFQERNQELEDDLQSYQRRGF
jgi:septal ring factor EnvC (AmiA/AmiB activator)